jgi:O-antigen ligase
MFQTGVPGLILLLLLWGHIVRAMCQAAGQKTDGNMKELRNVLPLALTVLLANGLFQEEVFAPMGWGFWMLLAGALLGQIERESMAARAPQGAGVAA